MKRKLEYDSDSGSDSDSDYQDSDSSNEDVYETTESCYSDSEIDYGPQREIVVIVDSTSFNDSLEMTRQQVMTGGHQTKNKKTKLDKKRVEIL